MDTFLALLLAVLVAGIGGAIIGLAGAALSDSYWILLVTLPLSFAWGWWCSRTVLRALLAGFRSSF